MPASGPSFSPFPFERLRHISRRDAALETTIARWIAATSGPLARTTAVAGAPVEVRLIGLATAPADVHAALAEVRIRGGAFVIAAASAPIRQLAGRLLGGLPELPAARPLAPTEHAIWALLVAAAIEDARLDAEVWPLLEPRALTDDTVAIELAIRIGDAPLTVHVHVPRGLAVRVPPPRAIPAWTFDVPIVVGRAAIAARDVFALTPRDAITVERVLELVIGDGCVGLSASPGALEATVVTGYGRRDMALPDEAQLELTVQLGTTRLTLRQLAELAVGQIIPLNRPLAGPYEVRVAGRVVGEGELVDLDGELGVRIVSIAQE